MGIKLKKKWGNIKIIKLKGEKSKIGVKLLRWEVTKIK